MSTLSISPGYSTIEEEFEASLRRAFVDRRWSSVCVYSRRQQFQIESTAYGVCKGWLDETFVETDSQSSELRYRLTEAGKLHFGVTW